MKFAVLFLVGLTLGLPAEDYELDALELTARIEAAEDAGEADELKSRMYGGWYPEMGLIRYTAGLIVLRKDGLRTSCSAGMITNTRLLTAAHCWVGITSEAVSMTVVLGSPLLLSGGTRIETDFVIVHSGFVKKTLYKDIAIIIVPAVTYTDTIGYAVLPYGRYLNESFNTYGGIVSGFGVKNNNDASDNRSLVAVPLEIINNRRCQKVFGKKATTESVICAAQDSTRGTCHGDSGAPFTVLMDGERMLVGVLSGSGGGGDCQYGNPAVFSRVTYFISWIWANL